MKKKLVVANWKMNPESLSEAEKLFEGVKKITTRLKNVQTVIIPPFVYLPALTKKYKGNKISFGAQNVFFESNGSYTGEISIPMLEDMKVDYVIVGHSERRSMGESNEIVHKKIKAVLSSGLVAILCIGEKERDSSADYLSFLKEELVVALRLIPKTQLKNLVVAYEPLWTIGKTEDEAMKSEQVHEMVIFIRKILAERFGKRVAMSVPVLYGGSVEPGNAKDLIKEGEISGFLVGHASLNKDDFNEILKIVNT